MIGAGLAILFRPVVWWSAIAFMVLQVWLGFARHYEKKGAERVVAQIEKKVEANAKKADAVRNSVQSVPAERLRDAWTRN